MPLPWKKNKVSRFSRIVADLQSPKGGSSLVVETGFPTSLVDLFVKNRERLKKPTGKKKKKKKRQQQLQDVEEELVISDPIFISSSLELVDSPGPVQNLENMESFDVCELVSQLLPVVEDDEGADDEGVDDAKVTDKKCWDEKEKRLLFVVLKIFLVVLLGLSTKKLVVGITMSAFVLIFLEYVGKHVLCFLKPCLNVEIVLELFVERVSSAFLVLKGAGKCDDSRKELTIQEGQQEEDVIGIDSCDLIETPEMKSSMEEIQVVEFNFDRIVSVEENSGTESRMDLLGCDWRKMEVEEDKSGVLACEKDRSRRSKIRRKIIKKLVPKKLRAIKKAKKSKEKEPDAGSESSSCWGDDEMGIIKVLEDGGKQGFENKGKTLLSKLLEEDDDDDEEPDQGYSSSSSGWQAEMEVKVADKKRSSDYLILFFVALAGLAGGRSLSLVLTLASCLLIKLVGRYRCVNEPVNRSRASISS
ncbi:ETHYLENE-REGULATED TRANSCRIPT 2 (ERT2) [Salix koriyanagi]|uniref:ETHYLENE-REGULATED TRANSCRIPT 2 (ERT2) n=1 Tax=Salix koriyanagi TaxID=2511006 RepID=A0A9Q0UCP5_9ROSI|nr:ETHYLENE-REGULATED TRANSCRIPT 2 (ERT2) [Salix koriyanagi]